MQCGQQCGSNPEHQSAPRASKACTGDKIIVIFGATGMQGGSVIRALMEDTRCQKEYKIRAVTRDARKPAAKKLEQQGCEVVECDMDNKQSVVHACKNVHSVFCVTNWEHMDVKREEAQGNNVVDACKENHVKHLVVSCLEEMNKISNGEFSKMAHFDGKARIAQYARGSGVPYTEFLAGFYMQNFSADSGFGSIFDLGGGRYQYENIYSEEAQIPLFDAECETGLFVRSIFINHSKTVNQRVLGCAGFYTPKQIVECFRKARPDCQELKYQQISQDKLRAVLSRQGLPQHAQDEIVENMMVLDKNLYFGRDAKKQIDFSHGLLDHEPQTFEQYARRCNKWPSPPQMP